jgi:gas vesicle protein
MERTYFGQGEIMSDLKAGDRAACFLLGIAVGAAAALLMAPASGERTRRRLVRRGEEVADYFIDAGKELVEKCEDLYERSGELAGDAMGELSGKYRALHQQTKQLLDETEAILRRAKSAATGR